MSIASVPRGESFVDASIENDPILQPLLRAGDEAARQAAMESLLVHVALPVIESVVRRKSGRFGRHLRLQREDEEDIRAAALYRIVRRLSVDLHANLICSLENYVAAVAIHVCDEHFARYSPEWGILRQQLRAILKQDAQFDVWSDRNQILCGRAGWRERPPAIRVDVGRLSESLPHGGPLCDALDVLFRVVGAPLLLAEAVTILAPHFAFRINASGVLFEEIADGSSLQSDALQMKEIATIVWREVRLLPREQRCALLLNLRDARQRSALRYLPMTGVATISDIAAALELDIHEFAELWVHLPMPDNDIATLLGATRQRVINLRSAARQRLDRRMRRESLR